MDPGSKNHIPCINGGLIKKYKNSRFLEYVITHDANNPTLGEEGDSFYIGENSRNT